MLPGSGLASERTGWMVSVTSLLLPGSEWHAAEEAMTQLLGMPSTDRSTISLSRPWLKQDHGNGHALSWGHREIGGGHEHADAARHHECGHRQGTVAAAATAALPGGPGGSRPGIVRPVPEGQRRLDGQQHLALLAGSQPDHGRRTPTPRCRECPPPPVQRTRPPGFHWLQRSAA